MFELATPWALLLIFIPILIWYFVPVAPPVVKAALKVPFFAELQANYRKQDDFHKSFLPSPLMGLIWICLVLALAGPRWVGEPIPLTRAGRNIMLVLDLSDSMRIDDMPLNGRLYTRLAVVKHAAKKFVEERAGDRIGLIVFGSQAYLQTPLTYDRTNVLQRIDDASAGLAGKTTSMGDALGLAVKRLQDVPPKSRVIILLTDGVNNSGVLAPLKAAELARDDKIKVYTIGLGSQNGTYFGQNTADLDEETLQAIAKMTGGLYFRAFDSQSLQDIYQTINELEAVKQETMTLRSQYDYYWCPLALAWGLLLCWLFYKSSASTWFTRFARRQRA